jgi:hypothetical protein
MKQLTFILFSLLGFSLFIDQEAKAVNLDRVEVDALSINSIDSVSLTEIPEAALGKSTLIYIRVRNKKLGWLFAKSIGESPQKISIWWVIMLGIVIATLALSGLSISILAVLFFVGLLLILIQDKPKIPVEPFVSEEPVKKPAITKTKWKNKEIASLCFFILFIFLLVFSIIVDSFALLILSPILLLPIYLLALSAKKGADQNGERALLADFLIVIAGFFISLFLIIFFLILAEDF